MNEKKEKLNDQGHQVFADKDVSTHRLINESHLDGEKKELILPLDVTPVNSTPQNGHGQGTSGLLNSLESPYSNMNRGLRLKSFDENLEPEKNSPITFDHRRPEELKPNEST